MENVAKLPFCSEKHSYRPTGFGYLPSQISYHPQMKGRMCIEYPFNMRPWNEKFIFCKINLANIFRSNALHGQSLESSIINESREYVFSSSLTLVVNLLSKCVDKASWCKILISGKISWKLYVFSILLDAGFTYQMPIITRPRVYWHVCAFDNLSKLIRKWQTLLEPNLRYSPKQGQD